MSATRKMKKTFGLLDADETLINVKGDYLNQALLDALKEEGIQDLVLFTTMSSVTIHNDLEQANLLYSRIKLIEELERQKFTVHRVVTPYDRKTKTPGRYYKKYWEPAFLAEQKAREAELMGGPDASKLRTQADARMARLKEAEARRKKRHKGEMYKLVLDHLDDLSTKKHIKPGSFVYCEDSKDEIHNVTEENKKEHDNRVPMTIIPIQTRVSIISATLAAREALARKQNENYDSLDETEKDKAKLRALANRFGDNTEAKDHYIAGYMRAGDLPQTAKQAVDTAGLKARYLREIKLHKSEAGNSVDKIIPGIPDSHFTLSERLQSKLAVDDIYLAVKKEIEEESVSHDTVNLNDEGEAAVIIDELETLQKEYQTELKNSKQPLPLHPGLPLVMASDRFYSLALSDHLPISALVPLKKSADSVEGELIEIKILSWNVNETDSANGLATNESEGGRCGEDGDQKIARFKLIAQALKRMVEIGGHHIIALQEILHPEWMKDEGPGSLFHHIQEALPGWGFNPSPHDAGMTLYRKDVFELEPEAALLLKEEYAPILLEKDVLSLKLKVKSSGQSIALNNVHLSYNSVPTAHKNVIVDSLNDSTQDEQELVTAVDIGDFNYTISPNTNTVNGMTSAKPIGYNDDKNGGVCIDGCFYQHDTNDPKQAKMTVINPMTGFRFTEKELIQSFQDILAHGTEDQIEQINRYQMSLRVENNSNKQAMADYEKEIQAKIGTSIHVELGNNLRNQLGVVMLLDTESNPGLQDVYSKIEKLCDQHDEFNGLIQFRRDNFNTKSYISCHVDQLPILNQLINEYIQANNEEKNYLIEPYIDPSLRFSHVPMKEIISNGDQIDIEASKVINHYRQKVEDEWHDLNKKINESLIFDEKLIQNRQQLAKLREEFKLPLQSFPGKKRITWDVIYTELDSILKAAFASGNTETKRNIKDIQEALAPLILSGMPDSLKIRELSKILIKKYRAIVRSHHGLPHFFGNGSNRLGAVIRQFCDDHLYFTLPKKLGKGEPLSLTSYNIDFKPVYHALVDGIESLKPPIEAETSQLITTLVNLLESPGWADQTFSGTLPTGIEAMREKLSGVHDAVLMGNFKEICKNRLEEEKATRREMTDHFYKIVASLNMQDAGAIEKSLRNLEIFKAEFKYGLDPKSHPYYHTSIIK